MAQTPTTVTLFFWAPPVVAQADRLAAAPEEPGDGEGVAIASAPAEGPGTGAAAASVEEADAAGFYADNPARLLPFGDQEGGVTIRSGAAAIGFVDTMFYLVPALCFDAVKSLAEGGTADVRMFTTSSRIALRRDGATVEIASAGAEPASFPANELLPALLAAGERGLELASRLWPEDPDLAEGMPYLRKRCEAARVALQALARAG